MVDTINPNTNEPDNLNNMTAPVQPATPNDRFYGGFDKPDDVKINLADSQPATQYAPGQAAPVAPQPQTAAPVMTAAQPVHDVSPVQPAETVHSTYTNTADMINWRGVLVIGLIALVATIVVGAGLYFAVSAMNGGKLAEQETALNDIKKEVSALQETPSPLELPVAETTPTTTPTVTPVEAPTVTPTPVETPQSTVPAETGNGRDGSLG